MKRNWMQIFYVINVVLFMAALVLMGTQRARTAYSSPVTVTNTPLTTDINENARHAVRLAGFGETNLNASGEALYDATTFQTFTVPTGKRLVIEQASLFAYPVSGSKVFAYWYNGHTYTAVPVTLQVPVPFGNDEYEASVPTRDYVDAGNQVMFTIASDWGANGFWDVHVIGYLIDCNGEC